jgi:F0F1-type ATP synthase membrane subunit b/b'
LIGAGTFINPLIKVLTTVAILAAIYFFFVKPALDTTENLGNQFSPSIDRAINQAEKAARQAQQQAPGAQNFSYQIQTSDPKEADRAAQCVARAAGDVARIQNCLQKVD